MAKSHLFNALQVISIHALREEGDRPPAGGGGKAGISIHALREEGDVVLDLPAHIPVVISIHALREEGDDSRTGGGKMGKNFYPRPPRGGRRDTLRCYNAATAFLSTPSARRATL